MAVVRGIPAYCEGQNAAGKLKNITGLMRSEPNNYLELSLGYAEAGLFSEALQVLEVYRTIPPGDKSDGVLL